MFRVSPSRNEGEPRWTVTPHQPPSGPGVRPAAAGISRRASALTGFNTPSYTIELYTKPQEGAGSA